MGARFRLLGTIEAEVGDRPVTVGYAQLQAVLAVLLVEVNRPVPVDQILDRVWGTRRLPRNPRGAVQHSVSLLRSALAAASGVRITWSPAGYQLAGDPDMIDLHCFNAQLDQARGADDETRARLLERALRLWRGEPFAGLDTPWFASMRMTLAEQHLAARLDLFDVQLRRGEHADLVAELAGWVRRRPLNERLTGQYLLALYRCGRQAQALAHYALVRRRLAEQLGTDPSPPLQRLHQQILATDPAIAAPAAGRNRRTMPRQLPAEPRLFTGRSRELARLTAALDEQAGAGGLLICAITGAGGVGKTWLALRWAHRQGHRFPDGHLHANLHGFDPAGPPTPAATVLRGFLEALGVQPSAVPAGLDAQAALYRSLLADRRMLVVLDNARDFAQVEPLLPGSPTCTVLVTSREDLTSLVTTHGAHHLSLDVLTGEEAFDLLTRHLGQERIAAEQDQAVRLLAGCAGLPLAISIVAARAVANPRLSLTALAEQLHDHSGRLDAFDGGDPSTNLRAVLSWSYDALPTEAGTMFEQLGLAPGAELGLAAAASLTGLPVPHARRIVRILEHQHLVQQYVPGRYRMHDLVRDYAAERTGDNLPAPLRAAALRRLVDHYLHTAVAADRLLDPHRRPIELTVPAVGCRLEPVVDRPAALAWFTAERANLLAAQQVAADLGWHAEVWQLAWSANTYYRWQGRFEDAFLAWRLAAAATDRLGDPTAQVLVGLGLGPAYLRQGRHADVVPLLERTLALADQLGNRHAAGLAHRLWATVLEERGEHRTALQHAATAVRLMRSLDNQAWEAAALNHLGWCHARLGQFEQARDCCEAAMAMYRDHPAPDAEADTLDSLGYIAHHSGRHARARDYYAQALARYREHGYPYHEAGTLEHLGRVHLALDEPDQARTSWHQALQLYQTQHRTADAERVSHLLAEATGRPA